MVVQMRRDQNICESIQTVFQSIISKLGRQRFSKVGLYYIRLKRTKRFYVILGLLVFFRILVYILWPNNDVIIPEGVDPVKLRPFEPEVVSDFPKGDWPTPIIPKIIHWTFKGTSIPPSFHENIKSFVDNNPDWTFYLWTDEASRQFVADTHPELLPTFDYYGYHIRRADFIRYVVLYEMGGIYVDLDVIDFRPLDRLVYKYSCIFPTEPFEHAVLRAGVPYLINNAIMICKPSHPFIKNILENLPRFAHMDDVNDSTGPAFITSVFMMYNNLQWDEGTYNAELQSSNSPYFYKGELPEDHKDAVYIPNSQYFCNNLDYKSSFSFYTRCKYFSSLGDLQKRACASIARRGMVRERNRYTFLEHQFYRTYGVYHFYNYLDIYLRLFSKDIKQLVPGIKIYDRRK